ncbi:hypothetical protein SEVIR_8G204300v4 [Setaria viridis]
MELKSSSSYLQPASSTLPSSTRRNSFHGVGAATAAGGGRRSGGDVFGPTSSDPLCSLNLKETSEFVRSSFPMATMARSSSSNGHGRSGHHEASSTSSSSSSTASAQRRRAEPPPPQQQQQVVPATPGRPLQFFASPAHHHQLVAPRRSVPSKWEDAEKWLRQSSDTDYGNGKAAAFSRQRSSGLAQRGGGEEEKRAAVAVRRSVDALSDAHALALYAPPAEVLLKGDIFISRRIYHSEFVRTRMLSLQDCRQVHGQRGAVEGDLRVPERVLRAGAGEGSGGGGARRWRPAEGHRHGDDAAGQLVPHAAQEHLPGAAQHAGEPVGPAGAVRRQRRRDGHLGAGGLPPRQAGPGRAV